MAPASRLGGEVYERRLLEALPAQGVELHIGLPASQDAGPAPAGWTIQPIHPGRWLRWYVAPLAFVPYTVRRLRSGNVDVLRAHSVRFVLPSLLLARRLARSKVPIVVHHLHTDPAWRWLETPLLRRADAIVTISEFSRRQLVEQGVRKDEIHVVYPGVDRPPETPTLSVVDVWPAGPGPRLLFLGQLAWRKRPELAIQTLARGDGQLVVAGAGRLAGQLRSLAARLGVEDRVAWLEDVSDEYKWSLFAAADMLLFTSRLEGFGLVAAEAQAAGTPVIVEAGTSAAEIVEDRISGRVVAGEPEAFAEAVRWLSIRDLGDGPRRAAARFAWDRSAAAVAEVYRHLRPAQSA